MKKLIFIAVLVLLAGCGAKKGAVNESAPIVEVDINGTYECHFDGNPDDIYYETYELLRDKRNAVTGIFYVSDANHIKDDSTERQLSGTLKYHDSDIQLILDNGKDFAVSDDGTIITKILDGQPDDEYVYIKQLK